LPLLTEALLLTGFFVVIRGSKSKRSESCEINPPRRMSSSEEIQKQIEALQGQLDALKKNARQKIEKMSAEVKDSNPYSRLMALQRMGIVKDYERIRSKSVAVVGEYLLLNSLIQLVTHFFSFAICRRWRSGISDSRHAHTLWNWKTHPLRLR